MGGAPGAGDYWPGEAENLLVGIAEEQRQAGKRASKGLGAAAKASQPRSKAAAKVLRCSPGDLLALSIFRQLGGSLQGDGL